MLILSQVTPIVFAAQSPHYRLEFEAPAEMLADLRNKTLLGRWRTDPDFERAQLPLFIERMRDEALAIAQAAGYFSAKVRVERKPDAGEPALPVVLIVLDAGARTTVNLVELRLEGDASADPQLEKRLRDAWPLAEGSFFQTSAWDTGKRLLIEQLQQQGYLRARIAHSRAQVDPELTAASLRLTIDSGSRLKFGEPRISGNQRYPQSIVSDLMPWGRGDPYTFDALQTLQDRLRVDGHYTSATILPDLEAVAADPAREDVPIDIRVRERRKQRITTGLGFSTDKGARGLAGYDHYNVLNRGWIARTGVQAETVQYLLFANLRTPTNPTGHYYRAGVRTARLDVQNELTDASSVYIGRGKRGDRIEHFVSLQQQVERREVGSDSGPIANNASATSLAYAWTLRDLDSDIDPRAGYAINSQVSGGFSGRVSTSRTFARLYARVMHFLPMPEQSRLAGGLLISRVEAGWVSADSREDIPGENLFRAGGTNSVRGYPYLGLGVPEGNAIVGGRVLGVASLEYQHPISGPWAGAVFADFGNAADSWRDFRVVRGVGLGVRWRSPVGPINVDLAHGDAAHRWRFHLSVGYSF
jgi:translocation and assembly module TamA